MPEIVPALVKIPTRSLRSFSFVARDHDGSDVLPLVASLSESKRLEWFKLNTESREVLKAAALAVHDAKLVHLDLDLEFGFGAASLEKSQFPNWFPTSGALRTLKVTDSVPLDSLAKILKLNPGIETFWMKSPTDD